MHSVLLYKNQLINLLSVYYGVRLSDLTDLATPIYEARKADVQEIEVKPAGKIYGRSRGLGSVRTGLRSGSSTPPCRTVAQGHAAT